MNDITPQTIADRLQQLAAQMLDTADQMDYFGGFSLIGQHGKHLADAAVVAQSWADGIREDYPAEDDSALEQPTDRSALQAAGTHPPPGARHCESNAYQIEIRRISAERDALAARLDELERQEPVAWIYDWQAPEGPIRDWVTTNRAEIPEYANNIRPIYARPVPAEMSPDFTDTARAALLWVLWHHQGGSSPVGQPIRYALGMDAHEHLSKHQVQEAKRWAALTKAESNDFRQARPVPAEPVNVRLLEALRRAKDSLVAFKFVPGGANCWEASDEENLTAVNSAIAAAEAQQERLLQDMHDAGREIDRVMAVDAETVDRAWARFCGAFGDGPDAPYPGMIAAFETHYGQSFRDKEWRTEAACWAAAWSKATARAEASLAEPQPDADGWIPWAGGECPVGPETIVDVKLKDRGLLKNWFASQLDWRHSDPLCDHIIAYRIVEAKP